MRFSVAFDLEFFFDSILLPLGQKTHITPIYVSLLFFRVQVLD